MDADIAYAKNEIPRQAPPRETVEHLPRQACDDQNDPRYQKQPSHATPPRAAPSAFSMWRGCHLRQTRGNLPHIIGPGDDDDKPIIARIDHLPGRCHNRATQRKRGTGMGAFDWGLQELKRLGQEVSRKIYSAQQASRETQELPPARQSAQSHATSGPITRQGGAATEGRLTPNQRWVDCAVWGFTHGNAGRGE